MGIVNSIKRVVTLDLNGSEQDTFLPSPLHLSYSGSTVSDYTVKKALMVPTAFACVRTNSEAISGLPVKAFKVVKGRKVEVPIPRWLANPFDHFTSQDLISQIVISLMTHGNAFVAVARLPSGKPVGLVPLDPERCSLKRKGNSLTLDVTTSKGVTPLYDGEFFHIPWLVMPGSMLGMSPVQYAKQGLRIADNAQTSAATFLENGSMPSAAITFNTPMNEEAIKNFKNNWNQLHGGSGNVGKIAVLNENSDIKPLSFSAADSQLLETRSMQISELARIWGVPPHAIGDASGSTSWGSGLDSQTATWVNLVLWPLTKRLQTALTNVWSTYISSYCVEIDPQPMLLDTKSLVEVTASMLTSGIITPNEARLKLGIGESSDPNADQLILNTSNETKEESEDAE